MADQMKALVRKYISECEDIIANNDQDKAAEEQISIIAAFGNYIDNIESGLTKNMKNPMTGEYINRVVYLSNIRMLKCKLESYLASGFKANNKDYSIGESKNIGNSTNTINIDNRNNNSNNNSNNIEISVLFEDARKSIEENDSLSEEEIKEALERIKEIEDISKLEENKNKKWFKLRPTMEWLGTKGVAVATAVLGLITAVIKM
ncbi:hypothetical protein [Clostridium sp. LP20]|uniref:hypothetical protein n=1 Tax=Clostridium sp. LP20 TaxID=3418665 RepID=UPI003EE7DED2